MYRCYIMKSIFCVTDVADYKVQGSFITLHHRVLQVFMLLKKQKFYEWINNKVTDVIRQSNNYFDNLLIVLVIFKAKKAG